MYLQQEQAHHLMEGEKQVLQDAALNKIVYENRHNRLKDKQYRTAKEFMKDVMYQVPLNKLYQVLASCNYNESGNFCPALVKIIDPNILRINKNLPFLLQVWNRKGDMVFERPLKQPITNWNISDDKFIFQEATDSPDIYAVRLFDQTEPIVFKFRLPEETMQGRHCVNTYYSPEAA